MTDTRSLYGLNFRSLKCDEIWELMKNKTVTAEVSYSTVIRNLCSDENINRLLDEYIKEEIRPYKKNEEKAIELHWLARHAVWNKKPTKALKLYNSIAAVCPLDSFKYPAAIAERSGVLLERKYFAR